MNFSVGVVSVKICPFQIGLKLQQRALRSRCSVVGIKTRLRAGPSRIRNTIGTRDFSLLENRLWGSPTYSVGTGVPSSGKVAKA